MHSQKNESSGQLIQAPWWQIKLRHISSMSVSNWVQESTQFTKWSDMWPWRMLVPKVPWGRRASQSGPSGFEPPLYVHGVTSSPNKVQEITGHGWSNTGHLEGCGKHDKVWVLLASVTASRGRTLLLITDSTTNSQILAGRWREHKRRNYSRKLNAIFRVILGWSERSSEKEAGKVQRKHLTA